ncbi:MAG: 4-(cytidine 5'-diphospho)-2-C-methyl-D-erythritol kinase [Ruminococcaceae bacterium]|nr:4-(cytidine 5'-diphospho)-2-C-methyl-D-erythritol kinase [Oscillospiraceae bacterium]
MKIKAAAKINLFLDTAGILPDGYHALSMIMQSVDCFDTVRVDRIKRKGVRIVSHSDTVPTGKDNIAYKAAKVFFESTGIAPDGGVEIEIEKNIPMAAGLAGGSADAAAVIYALNSLYETGLSRIQLCEIGEKVGADVPFSLTGGTAFCADKGGVIAPLPPLKKCFIVLCKPDMGVSTKSAYKQLDEAEYLRHGDGMNMLYAVKNGDFEMMCKKAYNVFEQVIEVPMRPHIKATMKKHGAKIALMSGSGPTVYGVFADRENAESCAGELKREFSEVILAEPCEKSLKEII